MASKPSVNRNSSQRLPAPSLFIGPPSRNASDTSIIPPSSAAGARGNPLSRQRSQRIEASTDGNGNSTAPINPSGGGGGGSSSAVTPGVSWKDTPPLQFPPLHKTSTNASIGAAAAATAAAADHHQHQHHHAPAHHQGQQPDQPSTDAIWAEMQNTLEEVELSATTGTNVFQPGHSQALDELRTAQIALAQAWARSEAAADEEAGADGQQQQQQRATATPTPSDAIRGANDPLLGHGVGGGGGKNGSNVKPLSAANVLQMDREQKMAAGGGGGGGAGAASSSVGPAAAVAAALGAGGAAGGGVAGGVAGVAAAAARPRSGTETSMKSQLERDTENDIQLARKRREANDRYFQRVNAGVLDVVAKLEEVAKAMKGVEMESKEIWGDAESIDTASVVSK
ncbi:uncharacterized protein BKCO1_5300094 [Diplodia corticola]|uniref:Uncharacterized protein n=1 Tax=Diplodia corticola TaxID=236234 RepID=A0A1J9RU11_9PEZI|nr:uncharacterized protein BKCO1_5300094 [Diplodia corticola]OJD30997.1 hypothetical protein BKCO1_5300094 [Diplodia corticola]